MIDKRKLLTMREVEGVTGPLQCLGSAKFMALKLVGAVDPARKLRDFVRSEWARKNQDKSPVNCWGWSIDVYTPEFNRSVLPAACNDPTAGVSRAGSGFWNIAFRYDSGHAERGDKLLNRNVPLVVGVEFMGMRGRRGHFITVVKDYKGTIWAIDPWDASKGAAVTTLPDGFAFTRGTDVDMTGASHIPCPVPWFGYYHDSDLEGRHSYQLAENL